MTLISRYKLILLSVLFIFNTFYAFSEGDIVNIRINSSEKSNLILEFQSDSKVDHFKFKLLAPTGFKIDKISEVAGEAVFEEHWINTSSGYDLQYYIDIINYSGIQSTDFRQICKIQFDTYKLKGKTDFYFSNVGTSFDNMELEVEFHSNPFTIDYGVGNSRELIQYQLNCNPNTNMEFIENLDSCFILTIFDINMYNLKEDVTSITFDFVLPEHSELNRIEAIDNEGNIDNDPDLLFEKTSNNTYSVSYTRNIITPLPPNDMENNGRSILKLYVHAYDICHNDVDYKLLNLSSINEREKPNNLNGSLECELKYKEYYSQRFLKGDIDGYCFGDDVINHLDINILKDYLNNYINFDCYQLWAADIDDNGEVNAIDLQLLQGLTGIKDLLSQNIVIYPNPASDILNISYDNKIDEIQLIDIEGKILLTSDMNELNVSSIASGNYFILLKSVDDILMKKITISR